MPIRPATSLTVIAGCIAVTVALQAAEVAVIQRDLEFQPGQVTVKPGDTVVFVNDDAFGHNVYSPTPGGAFDIGLQRPGQRNAVVFRNPGSFDILCRIHPRMKAQVVVAAN
ncbi:MAG: methylamine utilization protein [Thalassobaculales bacterium]